MYSHTRISNNIGPPHHIQDSSESLLEAQRRDEFLRNYYTSHLSEVQISSSEEEDDEKYFVGEEKEGVFFDENNRFYPGNLYHEFFTSASEDSEEEFEAKKRRAKSKKKKKKKKKSKKKEKGYSWKRFIFNALYYGGIIFFCLFAFRFVIYFVFNPLLVAHQDVQELKALAEEYGPDIKAIKGTVDGTSYFMNNAGESMGAAFDTLTDTMNGFATNMVNWHG